MEIKEILEVPSAPQLTGIAGEVEALMHILGNKDITLPLPFLLGVSGVLFRFFVPTDFGLVNKGSSTLYFELTDGPDPVRVAARFVGWTYSGHLQNSLSGMFEKVVKSIQNGIPVLTRYYNKPALPALIVGYSFDDEDAFTRKLFIKVDNRENSDYEELIVPRNPDEAILEYDQWRNFVGIAEFGEMPSKDEQIKSLKLTLNRAYQNLQPHTISEGSWAAGKLAFEAIKKLQDNALSGASIELISEIVNDLLWSRKLLKEFCAFCDEYDLLEIGSITSRFDEIYAILEDVKLESAKLEIAKPAHKEFVDAFLRLGKAESSLIENFTKL